MNRRVDGHLRSPASLNARMNSLVRNSSLVAPFSNWLCLAIGCQEGGVRPVSGLLFLVGPSAVLFAVPDVSLDSVDGVIDGRRRTHVGKKVFEAFLPAFADRDASLKVKRLVFTCGRLAAAPEHERPGVVLLRRLSFVWVATMAVLQVCRTRSFSLQTPARLGVPVCKLVGMNEHFGAAGARANPCNASAKVFSSAIDLESTKGFSGEVFK